MKENERECIFVNEIYGCFLKQIVFAKGTPIIRLVRGNVIQDFEKIISFKTKFSLQEKSKRSIQVIASKHSQENQSASLV